MLNSSFFEDLSARLSALPPLAEEAREELRTKIEQVLKKSFANLDLLSREEFDSQRQALERAEQRVADLEASLTTLDQKLTALEEKSASD